MARERVAVTMDHLLVVGDLVRAAEGFRRTWKGEAGGEMASLPERAERLMEALEAFLDSATDGGRQSVVPLSNEVQRELGKIWD